MGNSYGQILRATSVTGAASLISVGLGLVRTKVVAMLLGPAGIGMIGLLQNIMATASVVAAVGLGTVGTRQVAEAQGKGDQEKVDAARSALMLLTIFLAVIGAVIFFLCRYAIAHWVLGDLALADEIGWLSLGVGLTVAAGSQGALLAGLRRIRDLAWLSVASAAMATVLGVSAVVFFGGDALVAFVLAVPLSSLLLGHLLVSKISTRSGWNQSFGLLTRQWSVLLRLGSSFMLAGLITTVAQLIVRSMVKDQLGIVALGHFEASWLISMTYIAFVLKAMGTDYYPRLTAAIDDSATANSMVNEQVETALLLTAPLFLIMLTFAPWIMVFLYSAEFESAAQILRWQVLGDVLKVASWPLGYIILAAGRGRMFVLAEFSAMATFVIISWVAMPLIGIQAVGVSFLMMYAVLLPVVYVLARRRSQFRWSRRAKWLLLVTLMGCASTSILSSFSQALGVAIGSILASLFGLVAFVHIGRVLPLPGILGRASHRLEKLDWSARLRGTGDRDSEG